jgi:hypothetical protein
MSNVYQNLTPLGKRKNPSKQKKVSFVTGDGEQFELVFCQAVPK